MSENSHIAMIMELRQDLSAHQKELSSKTKKLVQMENIVSSMRIEILNKNKVIDELKISSKLSAENRNDEMYLQIEEYKNEINSKESEKREMTNDYNRLQRAYESIKTQFESLSFKHKQQQQRSKQLESMYNNKINNLQKIHQIEIQKLKDQSYLSNNKETQNIQNSLKELKESHDRIESDLNTQIEDLKDQMNKRETEKQQLIKELHQLSDNYKKYASNEIQKLTQKLQRYENGDVEIVLHIQVDDDYMRNKRPPKKPAPPKPLNFSDNNKHMHSRHSSNESTHSNSNNGHLSLLSAPLSPTNINGSHTLTLKNIKSNPEFWSADHSNPNASHHQTYLSQGSMPSIDSNDDDEDDEDDESCDDDSKDSKESKPDDIIPPTTNNNNLLHNIKTFKSINTNNNVNKLSVNNGYVSRRKHPHLSEITTSKSASTLIPRSRGSSSMSHSSSSLSRQSPTPSFYVFRQSISNKSKNSNVTDKSYNALISQRYGKHEQEHEHEHEHDLSIMTQSKYTDSALGFIKNGVVSMWGSTPKISQTPGPRTSRARYLSSANSVGFPSTYNGIKRNKRTRSNQSSLSSFDFFSDNVSATSSTGYNAMDVKNGTASSVKLSASDALSNKSLELQRKMLMQANTRLAEDLKNEKKHVMIVKEKAHRKYKQLQIQMQTEHRQWRLKERQLHQKMEKQIKELKKDDHNISELQKKFKALQADYNMRSRINNENRSEQLQGVNNNDHELFVKIQSLETNNKSLIQQCEKYRRELSGLKHTLLSCNDTMKQQQNQILILNTSVSELRKLNGFGGGSSEQLLQKQIRLLKSQRRMLIKELKDLRRQNDKLKNIIVSGTPVKTYATQ